MPDLVRYPLWVGPHAGRPTTEPGDGVVTDPTDDPVVDILAGSGSEPSAALYIRELLQTAQFEGSAVSLSDLTVGTPSRTLRLPLVPGTLARTMTNRRILSASGGDDPFRLTHAIKAVTHT